MTDNDVTAMVSSEQTDAAEALVTLFREGLNNAVHLPEVQTDAEESAHALLGCSWFEAMRVLVAAQADLPDDTPQGIRICVASVIDNQLVQLAAAAMRMRGPIGPHPCGWHASLDQ